MKKLIRMYTFPFFVSLLLVVPHVTEAKVNARLVNFDGNKVTVSISLDSIQDIKGCTISTCRYWQMVFEKQEVFDTTTYHRYYSSDIFPGDRLNATYTFYLPAGDYSGFTLQGHAINTTGNCGYEEYSYICPDNKHIIEDQLQGITDVNDASFVSFMFLVRDSRIASTPTVAAAATVVSATTSTAIAPVNGGNESGGFGIPVIAILNTPSPRIVTADAGQVTYAYTVWNVAASQSQTLTDVTVTDDACAPVMFLAGDLNNNGKLDEGENWEYSCVTTLAKTTTDTAIATGYSDDAAHQVAVASMITTVVVVPEQGLENTTPIVDTETLPAAEPATATPPISAAVLFPDTGFVADAGFYSATGLRRPIIHIQKVTPPPALFSFGSGVTYSYRITNPSVVPIHDVVVSDTACAPITFVSGDSNKNDLLGPDEIWTYTCSTAHATSTRSIATVTGRANGFTPLDIFITEPGLPSTVIAILAGILVLVFVFLIFVLIRYRHAFSAILRNLKKWTLKHSGI